MSLVLSLFPGPANFMTHSPFTVEAQCKAIGNGVPLPMGRAIAKAVTEVIGEVSSGDTL